MAKLIAPDGTVTNVSPKNGKNFDYEEIKALIGCDMIQICEASTKKHMLIFDEEFLCKNDPKPNTEATRMMHPRMNPFWDNIICGNAVFCHDSEFE